MAETQENAPVAAKPTAPKPKPAAPAVAQVKPAAPAVAQVKPAGPAAAPAKTAADSGAVPMAPRPKPKAVPNVPPVVVPPVAEIAKIKPRHRLLALSFCLMVLLPIAATTYYLWVRAADQYASTVGFSVRREEVTSAMDILGGLSALTKSSSSDTDILYEFLRSQELVSDMDSELGLRKIWSKPSGDPIFTYDPNGSIEDLLDYWKRMVRTSYDGNSGLIEVRVLAFTPEDATLIAQTLLTKSSDMINDLSAIASEDTIRYARDELTASQNRVKSVREAITRFRSTHQIVDPTSDIQAQVGLVASLQNQLALAQIDIDLLKDSVGVNDPRLLQANRRVEVINSLIAAERNKVGAGDVSLDGSDYAALAAEYERLQVDREFAERAYVAALASFDKAQAEVQRKSRYLAAHIMPTKAEVSRFPERLSILGVLSLFLLLAWAISSLVAYSLKDRR